jgi:hypothetical protein
MADFRLFFKKFIAFALRENYFMQVMSGDICPRIVNASQTVSK